MKNYFPTGRRNYGRSLKRLLGAWDRNGSTSDPTPWQLQDSDDDDDFKTSSYFTSKFPKRQPILDSYAKWHYEQKKFKKCTNQNTGPGVALWFRRCATSRTVPGSIPGGVTGFFSGISPSDRTMALGSTQPLGKMSTRNIPGGKGSRCVRLITSPPSGAECHEIWEPKPPGTPWATPGLLRDSFTFTFYMAQYIILCRGTSLHTVIFVWKALQVQLHWYYTHWMVWDTCQKVKWSYPSE
jgi:hypothetical protein